MADLKRNIKAYINHLIVEACANPKVKDGIPNLENNDFVISLLEAMETSGVSRVDAINELNAMLEGRFPERQAYNKDGILVTFPTPEHKGRAIQRGTHFEKNPRPQSSTPPPKPPTEPPQSPSDAPADNSGSDLPPSDSQSPEGDSGNEPEKSVNQGGIELSIEPDLKKKEAESNAVNAPPPPVNKDPKTPEEIAAHREVVKQVLNNDDTVLTNDDLNMTAPMFQESQKLIQLKTLCEELKRIIDSISASKK